MRKTALNAESYAFVRNMIDYYAWTKQGVKEIIANTSDSVLVVGVVNDLKSVSAANIVADALEERGHSVEVRYVMVNVPGFEGVQKEDNRRFLEYFFSITIEDSEEFDLLNALDMIELKNTTLDKPSDPMERFRHQRQIFMASTLLYDLAQEDSSRKIVFVNGHKFARRGDRMNCQSGDLVINPNKPASVMGISNLLTQVAKTDYIQRSAHRRIKQISNQVFVMAPLTTLLGTKYYEHYFSDEAVAALENAPTKYTHFIPSPDMLKDFGLEKMKEMIIDDFESHKENYTRAIEWEQDVGKSFLRGGGLFACPKRTLGDVLEELSLEL